jgi:non-specific serine/threonine protein kinase
LVELTERLHSTHLLTLTGTGGCGKTRLALEMAAGKVDDYADGVWLAELAGLADPELVAQTVATATGVRESAGQPIRATLLAALRSCRMLVVLDNCEHLVVACAELADAILRACPNVQILATSRESLGIAGELAWRVPSLTVAPEEATPRPDHLLAYEAVRMFVDRAAAVEPSFLLNGRNAAAVAQICRRLDGIPLAIELAARRVAALSVEQIAWRLDERFRFLTGGSRVVLPRQQTLGATVEWSYNLLSRPERALFDRLAVFAGGFTLEAAEAICGDLRADRPDLVHITDLDAESHVDAADVLDLLSQLVQKSLVLAEVAAETERYRLLETLRQYARERLVARGELEQIRGRHAVYYQAMAVEAGRHLLGADQVSWLDRLDRDHDNLHAALRWSIERQDAEMGMRLAASLHYFWYFRGHYSEGRALRTAVLALPSAPDLGALRAELLYGSGMLALHQGDYARARSFLEEGLAIARQVDDQHLLAPTLATLGFVTRVLGDYAAARPALEEALTLARAAGDDFHTAMALHHLGLLALEADRDTDASWSLNQQSLAVFRRIGNRRMSANVLTAVGRVARARGDSAQARASLAEALVFHQDVGDAGQMPHVMYTVAALDADVGRLEDAVRLAAAGAKLEESLGTRVWPVILRERDAWLEPARRALGDESFARGWAKGQAMTREEAVAYALEASSRDHRS